MTNTNTNTLNEIRTLIATTLGIEHKIESLHASTMLLGGLPEFDSMAVVQVISEIERQFDLVFDDDEVTGELFETLGSLADFVAAKKQL